MLRSVFDSRTAPDKVLASEAFPIFLALLLVLLITFPLSVVAQSGWSPVITLLDPEPGWQDLGLSLASDQFGYAHLAWLHFTDGQATFFYSRWDGSGWTTPQDIIADDGALGWPVLVPGGDGRVHIFWSDGYAIYHTWAWISAAGSARAWVLPEPIWYCERFCSVPMDAELDGVGIFHIVYAEREGSPFYFQFDEESGNATDPVQITPVESRTTSYLPRVAVSGGGTLHAIWTESRLPNGPTLRVRYSRSIDAGQNWSAPLQLGGQFHSDGNVIVTDGGVVHLAWNGGVGAGNRYYQFSVDDGSTWSSVQAISSLSGLAGYPSIVQDGSGRLHIVTGQGEYAANSDGRWSAPYRLPFYADDVEQSRLTIVRGNQLVAVSPRVFSGMYYSVMSLPISAVPTRNLPEITAEAVYSASVETMADIPTVVPAPVLRDSLGGSGTQTTVSVFPIIVASALSLVCVVAGLVLHRVNRCR